MRNAKQVRPVKATNGARRANHFALSEVASSPSAKNILLPFFRNTWLSSSHPAAVRGAYRDRHGRKAVGCGGREDAQRACRADESMLAGGQVVWSCPPDAGDKPAGERACRRWRLSSPALQGEREAAVKTAARGMPAVSAEPVVTAACVFCCRRAMGAASIRHSPRPLGLRG